MTSVQKAKHSGLIAPSQTTWIIKECRNFECTTPCTKRNFLQTASVSKSKTPVTFQLVFYTNCRVTWNFLHILISRYRFISILAVLGMKNQDVEKKLKKRREVDPAGSVPAIRVHCVCPFVGKLLSALKDIILIAPIKNKSHKTRHKHPHKNLRPEISSSES